MHKSQIPCDGIWLFFRPATRRVGGMTLSLSCRLSHPTNEKLVQLLALQIVVRQPTLEFARSRSTPPNLMRALVGYSANFDCNSLLESVYPYF